MDPAGESETQISPSKPSVFRASNSVEQSFGGFFAAHLSEIENEILLLNSSFPIEYPYTEP